MQFMLDLVVAGLLALRDYVAAHVLTCLIPAFLLAGAMVAFINKQAILTVLGEQASKWKSFSLACLASFFVAASSCTVIPVSSGLYYTGAAVGVAFIILWVAPSAKILSLIYTGNILGPEIVVARVVASLFVAFVVGGVMTAFFGKEKRQTVATFRESDTPQGILSRRHLILLVLILLSLLLPNYIGQRGPYLNKILIWGAATLVLAVYSWMALSREEITSWLRESWWFFRIILSLLLVGVILTGIIGKLLPEKWIQTWLGGNGIVACFLATVIGSVSYFATMTEAPFVDTLMKLGMGKGSCLDAAADGAGAEPAELDRHRPGLRFQDGPDLRHFDHHFGDLGWMALWKFCGGSGVSECVAVAFCGS